MRQKRSLLPDFEIRSTMLFALVLIGAMLAASARAQQAPSLPPTAALDSSSAERQSKLRLSSVQVQQAFKHIDRNGDGSLSRGEVSIFPRIERFFERIDANHDGSISPAEFEEALQQAS